MSLLVTVCVLPVLQGWDPGGQAGRSCGVLHVLAVPAAERVRGGEGSGRGTSPVQHQPPPRGPEPLQDALPGHLFLLLGVPARGACPASPHSQLWAHVFLQITSCVEGAAESVCLLSGNSPVFKGKQNCFIFIFLSKMSQRKPAFLLQTWGINEKDLLWCFLNTICLRLRCLI